MITLTIIAIVAAFLVGVISGVVALQRLGIARDESAKSLRGDPTTRAAAATRRVLDLHVHMPHLPQPEDATEGADAEQGQRPPTARCGG